MTLAIQLFVYKWGARKMHQLSLEWKDIWVAFIHGRAQEISGLEP